MLSEILGYAVSGISAHAAGALAEGAAVAAGRRFIPNNTNTAAITAAARLLHEFVENILSSTAISKIYHEGDFSVAALKEMLSEFYDHLITHKMEIAFSILFSIKVEGLMQLESNLEGYGPFIESLGQGVLSAAVSFIGVALYPELLIDSCSNLMTYMYEAAVDVWYHDDAHHESEAS